MLRFQACWLLSLVALVLLAFWIGWKTGRGLLGILVDERGRYSLTHFQLVLWTIVILSSVLGILISQGPGANFNLTPQLLGLMGISAGSGVLASGVKASKDAPGSTAKVARAGAIVAASGMPVTAHLAQIWLEEEGAQADTVVSITKYQNFIFTLVIVGFYVTATWKGGGTLPTLPDNLVLLLGVSHAGYVGGKVPNKA